MLTLMECKLNFCDCFVTLVVMFCFNIVVSCLLVMIPFFVTYKRTYHLDWRKMALNCTLTTKALILNIVVFRSVFRGGSVRVQLGYNEGSVRVGIGKPNWTLTEPSLYPLWMLWIQRTDGSVFQDLLQWNEIQKKNPIQDWSGFMVRIGFNATLSPSTGEGWRITQ